MKIRDTCPDVAWNFNNQDESSELLLLASSYLYDSRPRAFAALNFRNETLHARYLRRECLSRASCNGAVGDEWRERERGRNNIFN